MQSFRADSGPITISIPFEDHAGERVTPTAISWRLVDDEGAELLASAPIVSFDANSGQVSVTIAEEHNSLAEGVAHGFRRVEAEITTATGTVTTTVDYLLDAPQPFTPGVNTFMTYESALVQARSLGSLMGWDGASEQEQKSALFRAYDAMRSFVYTMHYTDGTCEVLTLAEMAEDDDAFISLKPAQIVDMRRAQLLQADYILGGNQIERDIGDGLQSSTIGEVSQFFRPRPTMTLALCKAALGYVGKYIRWGLQIGRA